MLTSTLRKLADDGIVSREVFTEVPPRVEYRLSERGQSLMPHLDSLISWGLEHQNSILKDRTKHSKSNKNISVAAVLFKKSCIFASSFE